MGTIPLYLGLGSNLGDKAANLREALSRLDEALGQHYAALSDFIETEPWGFESEELFLNAVVRYDLVFHGEQERLSVNGADGDKGVCEDLQLKTLSYKILRDCKRIEREMGRTGEPEYDDQGTRIYRSRVIDIDILLLGTFSLDESDLKIPHPLMQERDFVMIPLQQVLI